METRWLSPNEIEPTLLETYAIQFTDVSGLVLIYSPVTYHGSYWMQGTERIDHHRVTSYRDIGGFQGNMVFVILPSKTGNPFKSRHGRYENKRR